MSDLSGVSLDLSGVSLNVPVVNAPALNSQFLQVITELLQNKPQTKAEAIALYHSVTVQLSAYLVSSLPPHQQKGAAMSMWAVQELESGNCAATSWSCVPN